MAEAESGSTSPMFARTARMRAFARAMGDDMSKSTVGYATPMFSTHRTSDQQSDEEILMENF